MNYRYLFRAKRKNWRELPKEMWLVEGYLYGILERRYILWGMINDVPNMIEVDPSTICQCTGLKDKNGKLIWENDVVKATVRQNSLCQSSSYSDFYQVAYHENNCYFYLKKKNNNLLFDGNWSYYLKSIEVIGNIFDNPELINE